MQQRLTGINIRKGLEIEVSVEDIFTPTLSNVGDIRAKQFFENPKLKSDKKFINEISEHSLLEYRDFVTKSSLGKYLNVCVYNKFDLTNSKFTKDRFHACCTTELIFYNTSTISFDDFCLNLMSAQAFTGNFANPVYHEFTGIGNFEIESAASIYPLAIAGNLSLNYFFINYKGILTSISKIISAQFEDDILEQKSYLGDKNFKTLRKELKTQQEVIANILNNI